ncbi:MAG: PAS domain-containing sensor histidine kinase [Planctomycetaceae bacterium]|nr:PAS domain-containing sensor histidine kinase [Planctomycetaceae bacterium]
MWTSRLFWKLFAVYAGLLLAFVATLSLVLAKWNQAAVKNATHARLSGIAAVVRSQLGNDLAAGSIDELRSKTDEFAEESGVRITLSAKDGGVLADSVEDPAAMQNHRNRPDLIAAREQGIGENIRRSPTLGRRMQYYSLAVLRDDELVGFVRVSVDEPSVGAAGWSNQRALWGLGLVTLLSVALASHLRARSIAANLQRLSKGSQAMAAGDFEPPIAIRSNDEFENLAEALSEARATLATRIAGLEDHNETMSTVLGGMVEGVLAVDSERRILLANEASLLLLNVAGPVAGRSLLEVVRNVEIEAFVTESLQADSTCQREIDLPGPPRRTLHVLATQLASATKPGVVVVLHDVTALRRLENMRRDFVANVSHELKTPLASIKAYSETLRMGAINDPEHNLGFVERISEQAERLHQLIADILHLARVESGDEAFEMTAVDVGAAVERCVAQHRQFAAQRQVDLRTLEPRHRATRRASGLITTAFSRS